MVNKELKIIKKFIITNHTFVSGHRILYTCATPIRTIHINESIETDLTIAYLYKTYLFAIIFWHSIKCIC